MGSYRRCHDTWHKDPFHTVLSATGPLHRKFHSADEDVGMVLLLSVLMLHRDDVELVGHHASRRHAGQTDGRARVKKLGPDVTT